MMKSFRVVLGAALAATVSRLGVPLRLGTGLSLAARRGLLAKSGRVVQVVLFFVNHFGDHRVSPIKQEGKCSR